MLLEGSCPHCKGDLHGTPRKGYYCPRCNMLFRRHTLALRHIRQDLRKLIDEHFANFEQQLTETKAGIDESAKEGLHDLSELQAAVNDLARLLDKDLTEDERDFEAWKASRATSPLIVKPHRVIGKREKPKKATGRAVHKTTMKQTVKRAKKRGLTHVKKRRRSRR
ncbi:hypothetical protein D6789_02955 [Candidatus Woesearchaeota archaeon]|nr:MAG: hypothetical protein D6789_02955 [Candidatus Woesearchaeota archaeon]